MLVYYLLLCFSGNKVVFNTFGRYCIRVPISQRLIVMYGIGYMMQNQVNKSIKMIAPVAATAFVAVMLAEHSLYQQHLQQSHLTPQLEQVSWARVRCKQLLDGIMHSYSRGQAVLVSQ